MKKRLIFVLSFASLLIAEELPAFPRFEEKPPLIEEERSQFIYVSTGINPLPTAAVGYRKLYGSFGSDLSISTSLLPIASCGRVGIIPIPGFNYKQLFFKGMDWKGLPAGKSIFYFGIETSIYPLGSFTLNGGGLLGWQFRREKRWDFFEIGINPLLYSDNKFSVVPLASLTYAFLF
jgi:hypothetical protein